MDLGEECKGQWPETRNICNELVKPPQRCDHGEKAGLKNNVEEIQQMYRLVKFRLVQTGNLDDREVRLFYVFG